MQTTNIQRNTGGGNLSTHTWKSFKFNEVFTLIKRGKRLKKADHVDGSTPYVSSTSLNNGVDGFIGNEDRVRVFEDCLTIANSGSVGETFYHQYSFVASDHVTQLKRDGLDKYTYLFMVPIIRRLSEKYSFNREINDDRISREQIILPVTSDGSIDFEFMSSFMKSLEVDILSTTLEHFRLRSNVNICKLGGVNWKAFNLSEIFSILPGKRLTKNEMSKGRRPFIGATDSNNGVTAWVSNTNESIDSNVLGVNYNGSVGEVFYHPYECIFSDDVKRLHIKKGPNSKYIYLFLKTILLQQKYKYEYGYKFNEQRMLRQTILLPTNNDGTPDWSFMDSFMRNKESERILLYLKHLKPIINTHTNIH